MSKKIRTVCIAVICCMALSFAFIQGPTECHGFEISIDVAPSTLNIQSQGQIVTVHTSIAYSSVIGASVELNGLGISWWKADNQGNFVAKFEMSEVKALADTGDLEVPGENTLTLTGTTTEGTEFTGSQVITVVNVEPVGTGGK